MWIRWLTICLVLASTGRTALAGDLSVQAAISSKSPYVGDTVVFQITVRQSVEKLPELDASALEALGAKMIGEPGRGHSLRIENGARSEEYTFQYQFQFVAQKAGPLSIPPVVVRQGKERVATEPVAIDVIGAEAQDWAAIEIVPSQPSVYPGQTVTLTVQLFLRRLVHQEQLLEADPFGGREPPRIRIPWLGGTDLLERSRSLDATLKQRANEDGPSFPVNDLFQRRNAFSFFDERISQDAIRFDREAVERQGLDGEQHSYYRYSLPLEFRAVRPGSVGPLTVQLRGSVYVGVRKGRQGLEADHREMVVVSPPFTLNITAIPKAGQPDTFTGGVGVFKATAAAQPAKVRVGDPITLTVRVTGTGTLEDFGPPNLAAQEKWTRDFKIHDDPSLGRMEDDAKLFTFSIRPKQSEVKELPTIRLSYFNPKTKRYDDTFTERIPLEVSDTPRLDPAEIMDATPSGKETRELEELAGGLAANYTGPDVLDPQGPYLIRPVTLAAVVLVPPMLWLAVFTTHRRAVRRRQNPAWLRSVSAYRRALERLDSATRVTPQSLPDEVVHALAAYLADRLDLPAGELTPTEARHYAMELGATPELSDQLAGIVERCESARFARTGAETDSFGLLHAAREALDRIERVASANGRRRAVPTLSIARLLLLVVGIQIVSGEQLLADESFDRHACLARANAAFERGARAEDLVTAQQAFSDAIAAYQELVADGVDNGKLYYNLANAYFRAGDVPRAILCYRQAERLMPRDDQAAANLAFARSRVADRIEPTETSRLLRQLLVVHYAWSVRERTQAAMVSLVVGWLLLGACIPLPRRWLAVTGVLCLAMSLSLACSVYVQFRSDREHPVGVLVSDEVVVRKGDGETYEPQFNRSLGPGIEFRLLDRRDNWLQIELPDGKSGWVQAAGAVVSPRIGAGR